MKIKFKGGDFLTEAVESELTLLDFDKRERLVGMQGYVGDSLGELREALDANQLVALTEVEPSNRGLGGVYPFGVGTDHQDYYRYFLPKDKVIFYKAKEKKDSDAWHPFGIEE